MSVASGDFRGYSVPMAGRPKGPTGNARGNVLRIRLTDEERQLLDAAASEVTLDTSTWARSELLALAKRIGVQIQPENPPTPQHEGGNGNAP